MAEVDVLRAQIVRQRVTVNWGFLALCGQGEQLTICTVSGVYHTIQGTLGFFVI